MDVIENDVGLETTGVGLELLHEFRALNAFCGGWPVVDFSGRHQLSALCHAGDQNGLEIGACGVDGSGISSRTGTQNQERRMAGDVGHVVFPPRNGLG